jgi:hypothetical protein
MACLAAWTAGPEATPAHAADLCDARHYPFGGALGHVAREALSAEFPQGGPSEEREPYEAVRQWAEREKVTTLSPDKYDGQIIEDLVARYRVSKRSMVESREVYVTPWGELVLSQVEGKAATPRERTSSRAKARPRRPANRVVFGFEDDRSASTLPPSRFPANAAKSSSRNPCGVGARTRAFVTKARRR